MPDLATLLPLRRTDLLVRPFGADGQYVVKDSQTGDFYHLGEAEHFLLMQLDGRQSAATVRTAFEHRFGEPLSEEELDQFLELAREQRLLGPAGEAASPTAPETSRSGARRQSILYWRRTLFDPDRFFTWLAPRIGFFWSWSFLVLSAGCILTACVLLWANRQDVTHSISQAVRGETAILVWLTLMIVTMLHESAHGLTCKYYGGEVHEIGFLLLFFMPCFYCNVSDAWLFKEKSKRLWVTFAGGYFELFLWALAVFVWRLTLPETLAHRLAFVVLSVCGIQTLFNFNPLLKLDGYYLVSDWLEVPNLQQRGMASFKGQVRRLLWGAPRPAEEPRGRLLLGFGLVSWLYGVVFLVLMLWALLPVAWRNAGWFGAGAVLLLGGLGTRGMIHGFAAGEVRTMIATRRKRAVLWLASLGAVAAVLGLVEIEDRAGGPFRLRPALRAEVRAPVAGFIKEVTADEGDRVSAGALLVRLEVPELESRLAQKLAELAEAQARLRLLEIGPRYEEIEEQRARVDRARAWRDLAEQDLARNRQALTEDLDRLDKQIAVRQAAREAAQENYRRARLLVTRKALAEEQFQETEALYRMSQAHLAEAQAAKRALQARGTQEAEAERARREKELADAQAVLRLLEAGTRPEEIEAERARQARLREEVRHLQEQRRKQTVAVPVTGVVTTARLKEKLGQFVREGDLICLVEEPAALEAEISLAEQDVARVQAGQEIRLKTRALPFDAFFSRVDRLAPAAGRGEVQSNVIVYCRLDAVGAGLKPEMTGHARIYTGRRPIGAILFDRAVRLLRTELWW
jgi:multidrug resistance efflux pump